MKHVFVSILLVLISLAAEATYRPTMEDVRKVVPACNSASCLIQTPVLTDGNIAYFSFSYGEGEFNDYLKLVAFDIAGKRPVWHVNYLQWAWDSGGVGSLEGLQKQNGLLILNATFYPETGQKRRYAVKVDPRNGRIIR